MVFFDGVFESSDSGGGRLESPFPFARQHDLEDATVRRVWVSLDQAVTFERREYAIHRLRRGVAGPRKISA